MNNTFLGQSFMDDADGELVLIFLTEFRALEQALLRAGFIRPVRAHGNAQPDWGRFVRQIEGRFRPDASPELQGAVNYLLTDPVKGKARWKRLQNELPGEASSVHSDIVWLSELILEAQNKLTFGMPILDEDGFDSGYIMAALLIVEAWSYCDPTIESLLAHVQ
jgi:hypothetical protein